MIGVIRGLLFWFGLAVSTAVLAIGVLLLVVAPFRVRQRFSTLWAYFNIWWLRITCGLDFQVEGAEHIPDGAAIYLVKHQSAWETIALNRILPPVVWVLKRNLLWIPLFGWAAAVLRPVAINRSRGRQAMEQLKAQGARRLSEGTSIVIFPEGTRTAPGSRRRYRVGGALLAEHTGCPVVPVAHNAGEFWPRRGFVKRPGTVRVIIGPPLDPRDLPAEEINRRVEEWIETRVAALSGDPTPEAEKSMRPEK